ncbi:hypothetical protein EVAR_77276_1 [Eumeta japonica]|uniref:Uncharacterized protein n=1 Tax=Eumeta variegata TaxID=151549 RepID=A0A4C1UMP3_EUMVA|nr:hypothetical protein EVAR_77276_1 [Eumeta japonica]
MPGPQEYEGCPYEKIEPSRVVSVLPRNALGERLRRKNVPRAVFSPANSSSETRHASAGVDRAGARFAPSRLSICSGVHPNLY